MSEDVVRLVPGRTEDRHPYLETEINGVLERVCADSWCDGACGMPALASSDGTKKVYGPMVALGRVLQPWRVTWTGKILHLSEAATAQLSSRFWW